MKKIILVSAAVVLFTAIIAGLIYKREIERMSFVARLFTGAEQYENFNQMADIFPVSTMPATLKPYQFSEATAVTLPEHYTFNGNQMSVNEFLQQTDTSALLVIKEGKVYYEKYWLTGGRNVHWLSMSVAKSFIATGIGIAVDNGLIDISKPITDYVPSLSGSAYDEVRIKDVLQMSSGAAWNEDYNDPDSDVIRMGHIMAIGGSLDEFVPTLVRENTPGTKNHYNSADTQALGMLLARATGQSVTTYLTEKIWQPLGMEAPGYWLLDDFNVEMAFAGLNATARDYAKLGELHRLKGKWQGKQIVSEQWVAAATKPDAPHLMPGINIDFPLGYGYQWWIPEGNQGEYSAIGVYNQFIYVNPTTDVVIVKLSANSDYGTTKDQSSSRETETIEFFRAVQKSILKL